MTIFEHIECIKNQCELLLKELEEEDKYAPNDIPGFEGALEKLNDLTIFKK